jgi:hypothetical protein
MMVCDGIQNVTDRVTQVSPRLLSSSLSMMMAATAAAELARGGYQLVKEAEVSVMLQYITDSVVSRRNPAITPTNISDR